MKTEIFLLRCYGPAIQKTESNMEGKKYKMDRKFFVSLNFKSFQRSGLVIGGSSSSSKALLHIVMESVRNIAIIFWLGLWLCSSPWAEIIMATLHPGTAL